MLSGSGGIRTSEPEKIRGVSGTRGWVLRYKKWLGASNAVMGRMVAYNVAEQLNTAGQKSGTL